MRGAVHGRQKAPCVYMAWALPDDAHATRGEVGVGWSVYYIHVSTLSRAGGRRCQLNYQGVAATTYCCS